VVDAVVAVEVAVVTGALARRCTSAKTISTTITIPMITVQTRVFFMERE